MDKKQKAKGSLALKQRVSGDTRSESGFCGLVQLLGSQVPGLKLPKFISTFSSETVVQAGIKSAPQVFRNSSLKKCKFFAMQAFRYSILPGKRARPFKQAHVQN